MTKIYGLNIFSFSYIEDLIRNLFESNREEVPNATMMDLENQWDSFSVGIQKSIYGVISPPIIVTNRFGIPSVLDSVSGTRIALNIGILFFVCNNFLPLNYDSHSTRRSKPNYSDSIVVKKGTGYWRKSIDIGCIINQEPTVRIVGRDGLCAEVRDGRYSRGNAIALFPCKSNIDDLTQLWTLKADGTIRSNGDTLCLTTYDYSPGNYIMIFNCETAVPDATKWKICDNGTIINPRSSNVLSANSASINTTLIVAENLYSASQAWVISNNTLPFVTPIMNGELSNMCLQAFDYRIDLGYSECQSLEKRQMFALYPDSSIRPNDKREDCLTADVDNRKVIVAKCNGAAEQRWLFNRDYTISNLNSPLVMDIAVDNYIYLNPPTVPPGSQEWRVYFP